MFLACTCRYMGMPAEAFSDWLASNSLVAGLYLCDKNNIER